jgi:hypothetical protein
MSADQYSANAEPDSITQRSPFKSVPATMYATQRVVAFSRS